MNDDRKTRVIGIDPINDDYNESDKEFMAKEIDELAFLDEQWKQRGPHPVDEEITEEDDVQNVDEEDTNDNSNKKKSKGGIIIAIIIVLALIVGGIVWFMGQNSNSEPQGTETNITEETTDSAVSGEMKAIDIDLASTLQEPKVTGFDGDGVLGELTLNQNAIRDIISGIDNEEQQAQVKTFFENVEYNADKTEELSAGDKITITADYDEIIAKDAKINVVKGKYIFTVGEMEAKASVDMPQWFKHVEVDGDELIISCLLLAREGTSMDLPIGFMYACEGGAFSDLIDASGKPDLTYNGVDYYMEPGCESPYGSVSEVDEEHITYGVTLFDERYVITVNYTVNDDGSINVDSADGGETPISVGKYEPISNKEAKRLGGLMH